MNFSWKDVIDQSGVTYRLQVASDENFTNILLEKDVLLSSELILDKDDLKSVTSDNPYYWRVEAVDGASNESKWSETRSFSLGFVLTLPNGESNLNISAHQRIPDFFAARAIWKIKSIFAENLSKQFEDTLAVDHINFDVDAGKVLALLGTERGGKTTTVRMLTSVLRPTSGSAKVGGV